MVAVITGGSSGIGKAAVCLFEKNGYKVYELSRRGEGENHISADVCDADSLKKAFDDIIAREKRIDVLITSAGMGISGAVEFTAEKDMQRIFDVNFFGTVRTIQAALPYLRQSKGHIVCLSSVAAPISIPFQSFYSCTKNAINALVSALANELEPFGVRISAVMPGDVHTGFTAAREKSTVGAEIYGEHIDKAVKVMEHDELNGMPPERVAHLIYKVASKKSPALFYTAGGKYKLFVFLVRLLPNTLRNRLVGLIYK